MAQITLRDYLQETEDAISAGNIDESLAKCQYILAYFPESLEAQRLLGEIYLAQGRLEEARHSFDWILTNDPENVLAYCNRALVSERLADYDTALDCYQQAYELSRGNSQIREGFNQLSAKVGQQGFMFSRAGLARLYMRGDLLSQAVQEWDIVLSAAPDRLDARTGLLETYWREGFYDQVTQLSTQILRDVPGCVKALLLLAHVTAPSDMLQAQDLLKRAEVLDPEMVMAHDLFTDLFASQPGHPFLKLLQKPPVSLNPAVSAAQASLDNSNSALNAPPTSVDLLAQWGNDANWNNETTLVKPRSNDVSQPSSGSWSTTSTSTSGFGTPENTPQDSATLPDAFDFGSQVLNETLLATPWMIEGQSLETSFDDGAQREPWQLLQDTLNGIDPGMAQDQPKLEELTWESLEMLENSSLTPDNSWQSSGDGQEIDPATSWTSSPKEEDASVPPAWLSMLTQSERRQLSGTIPTVIPPLEPEPVEPAAQEFVEPEPIPAPPLQEAQPSSEVLEPDEDSFFGPAWLKSLGATTLDAENSAEPLRTDGSVTQQEAEPEPQPSYEVPATQRTYSELQPSSEEPAQNTHSDLQAMYDWAEQVIASQSGEVSNTSEQAEQNFVATLEELENDLRSKGFVPLEPKSLSTIAQEQNSAVPAPTQEQEDQASYQESSLSSALSELGNYLQHSPSAANVEAQPVQPISSSAEPSWISALRSASTPAPVFKVEADKAESEVSPTFTGYTDPAKQRGIAPSAMSVAPGAFPEKTPGSVFEPTPPFSSQQDVLYETTKTSAVRPKPWLLDNSELETTMKRPAVRLQPMHQQRSTPMRESFTLSQKAPRPPERTPGKGASDNQSSQEHLVRGYQSQLVGDYDEAMQEYRVVIRNSPELLSEVVSNLRALLKLAPKYAAGYRVLGDAYMRQGEYLQAMEAYNKALTMAKKTKS